jgi:two-component system phosphate regulon sensor histidine kinase PhoR
MWPALIFIILALLVVADAIWRERRLRRQRLQAKEDYTRRLLAQQQEAYLHAQAQQRALFDSMTDGVLLLDAEGTVQMVNHALRRLMGLPAAESQGKSLLETVRLPALAALVQRLQREHSVTGFELELPQEPSRFIEVNASSVRDREGTYRGAILVFHDLTRVKQLENVRKEFVANVSHELRTPLSLIKGFVETLLEGAKEEPEICARYLQTIQRHTDRLASLIEDLLSISQLESGRVVLKLERLSMRAVAARIIDALQLKAAERQIRVRNDVPEALILTADAQRLEQVLFNLVENAIKYGRVGGEVRIGGCAQPSDRVEVWVRDDGPGIPTEAQARIFERFYRVDRARSRESGGTGLGLAIVKHIVLAHGGNVWLESKPAQGASFHFTLPQLVSSEPETVSRMPTEISERVAN